MSGKEWHNSCYQQSKGEQQVASSGINNQEMCPMCNKPVVGQEKVVIGGREMHKECYDSTKTDKVGSSGINNEETCPMCEKVCMLYCVQDDSLFFTFSLQVVGSSDKIIVSGKEWHNSCYQQSKGEQQVASSGINNQEVCPMCNQPVIGQEKVVIGGREMHKECYDSTKTDKVGSSGINNEETCPMCEKVISYAFFA